MHAPFFITVKPASRHAERHRTLQRAERAARGTRGGPRPSLRASPGAYELQPRRFLLRLFAALFHTASCTRATQSRYSGVASST